MAQPAASAVQDARALPLDTRFDLGTSITPVQAAFLDRDGFVVPLYHQLGRAGRGLRLLRTRVRARR